MALIASRLFNYIPDQHLDLANEEWIRPLGHLGDWQRIRLGMLVAIQNSGVFNIESELLMGLCSGRTNTVSSVRCDNSIGVSICGSTAGGTIRTWTYTAGAGNPYFAPSATNAYRRYYNPSSGNIYVNGSITASALYVPTAGIGIRKRRCPIVLDIQRSPSTGAIVFNLYWPANVGTDDYGVGALLDAIEQTGTPIVAGQSWSTGTATFANQSDNTGALDSFCIYWSNQFYPLELYAACVNLIQDRGTPNPTYPFVGGSYDLFVSASAGTATGLNTGRGWSSPYSFYGTNNGTGIAVGQAGSTIGSDDPFAQYTNGTALSGVLASGTGFSGAWSINGTYPNPGTLSPNVMYGTGMGFPDDPFDSYANGTILSTVLNGGTGFTNGWASAGTYPNPGPYEARALYGTFIGFPNDSFESYSTGTIFSGAVSNGTGWISNGSLSGYYNPGAQVGLAGTSIGFPGDDFESYGTGTITSGVTINSGTGWTGYGYVYP